MLNPNEIETSNRADTDTDTDTLKKDMDQLRKDVAALGKSAQQRSRDQLQAGVDKAYERFGGLSHEIETRPYTGILVAFGTGLLLGRILAR